MSDKKELNAEELEQVNAGTGFMSDLHTSQKNVAIIGLTNISTTSNNETESDN